jgi:uncharacterized membrane protein YidH (DUF202 family)
MQELGRDRGTRIAPRRTVKLNEKVQYALDESRMLVLGIQVLLGFGFQAPLMSGYPALPSSARVLKLVSLGLLLVAMTLVLAPVARHRIVDEGRDTPHLDAFARHVANAALLPFGLALGLDSYIVGCRAAGPTLGVIIGGGIGGAAVIAWYALPRLLRRRPPPQEDSMEETKLNDKIRHVLTEARVVLPGTQALLGFQFAGVLQQGFDALPPHSKLLHVIALAFLGASVVFLLLPTAYHRIAEGGEITERLHRFSSLCVLVAMGTLAVAVAADTFIVVEKATGLASVAIAIAAAWLAVSLAAWFVAMFLVRRAHRRRSRAVGPGGSQTRGPQPGFAH